MKQLPLAIDYLKIRAIDSRKLSKQIQPVLPLSEVEAVLRMVETGEFEGFIKTLQSQSDRYSNLIITL